MRLQKYLAKAGVASRRKSEDLIASGRVKVNGEKMTSMGYMLLEGDEVMVDGEAIYLESEKVYLALYKPIMVLSSASDDRGRKTVVDFYNGPFRVFPVGRLDYDSEGLIILTNDGAYAHQMMHPRFEKEKVYHVWLKEQLSEKSLERLRKGSYIDSYRTQPIVIELKGDYYEVVLREGRNRQIRKMIEKEKGKVKRLKRVSVGKISLGRMKPGDIRELTKEEIDD